MATAKPTPERTSSIVEKMKFRRRSDVQSSPKQQTKEQQANVSANMDSTLYSSGDWSDVTVACKNHVWHLHKEILITKCDYFRKRCAVEQQSTQPGQPIVITINDEDPQVIEALLRYIYTGDMDWAHSDRELHPYHFYSLVFKMAVKFKLPRLATLAIEPIELTDISRIDEELQDAIPDLYALPLDDEVRELRDVVIRKTPRPWGTGMLGFASYKALIVTVPEFALDTISFLARDTPQQEMVLPIQNESEPPEDL